MILHWKENESPAQGDLGMWLERGTVDNVGQVVDGDRTEGEEARGSTEPGRAEAGLHGVLSGGGRTVPLALTGTWVAESWERDPGSRGSACSRMGSPWGVWPEQQVTVMP